MADVATATMPVGEADMNVKKGAPVAAAGAGVAAAGAPAAGPKAHRAHHSVNFLLHMLAAMATAAALTTMVCSNQTVGGVRARWNDFAAFKWFLVANAVVLAYATLAALASLLGVFTHSWGPLSFTPLAWITFLVDFVLANALMSAATSATTIAWIGRRGQRNAAWPAQCGVVGGFCRRVLGALIASYIGWALLALSTIVAACAIHRLHRRSAVS